MFCAILLTLVLVCLFICFSKRVVCNKDIGVFPGCLPLIGHLIILIRSKDLFSIINELGTECIANSGIMEFKIGWKSLYILTNPDEATTVLSKCLEKMFVYKFIEPLFGNTLVSAQGIVWKRNRRILDLAFKQEILDSYSNVFNNQASSLVSMLSHKADKGYVDITDEVTRNVLETTFQTTMGLKAGENVVSDKYVKALHKVFEIVTLRVQKQWLIFDVIFNRTSYKQELVEALDIIHETSTRMVQISKAIYLDGLEKNERNQQEHTRSFLQILIENSVTPEDSIFTDHQLRCLCDNVLLAAFDTSTYELLFTLVCIGSDSNVQDKIYHELNEVLGEETIVTREHAAKLTYLEAAIKETLRLYPIGPIVAREATTDVQLGKVTIPAGSSIAVHIWAINRHKAYWGPDAEEYNPGRWLNPNTLPKHPNAFASFSFGRRNCIGRVYAMMYMKITLASVIRKYRIISDHKKMEFDCHIMLKVKSGHLVKLKLR